MKLIYHQCAFVKSAASLLDCPQSSGEVAFAGRSNAGKSSALNYLTNQKIAKTSKTPGRTQLINFFSLVDDYHLVDLPGYGYAKVSREKREKWQKFIDDYLYFRDELIGIVVVMDCRRPLQKVDCLMLDFCRNNNLFAHALLTKSDKLSKNQQMQTLLMLEENLNNEWPFASAQLFSSTKKIGVQQLNKTIDSWLF